MEKNLHLLKSLIYLLFATLSFYIFFVLPPHNESKYITKQIEQYCPNNPSLASRMSSRYLYIALSIAKDFGENGLKVLEYFEDEAVFIFEQDKESFKELTLLVITQGVVFENKVPWKQVIVDWTMQGRIKTYLKAMQGLSDNDLQILKDVPPALPLLLINAPTAKKMLKKYKMRAWRLFALIDFTDQSNSLERMAEALNKYGTKILNVNEEYSLAGAFFFLPPVDDNKELVPKFFYNSIQILGRQDAVALFLTNYETIIDLILNKRKLDQLNEFLDWMASLKKDSEVKQLFFDNKYTLLLAMEYVDAKPIGASVYEKCGPAVAEVLYHPRSFYSSDVERKSVLLILDHFRFVALESLILKLRGDEHWHKLLSRSDLHLPKQQPLLIKVVHQLLGSEQKQDLIEKIGHMPVEQIDELYYEPTTGESIVRWIPGYYALKVVSDYSKGYKVDNLDLVFGALDATGGGAKIIGKIFSKTTSKIGKESVKKSFKQLAKNIAQSNFKQSGKKLLYSVPGATYAAIKSLPSKIKTMDIKVIIKISLPISKRVGMATWNYTKDIGTIYLAIHTVTNLGLYTMDKVYSLLEKK